jgi:hypothetical protein
MPTQVCGASIFPQPMHCHALTYSLIVFLSCSSCDQGHSRLPLSRFGANGRNDHQRCIPFTAFVQCLDLEQ